MFDNPVVAIIVILIVAGLIAAAAYYIIRFMRGTIKLTLSKTGYAGGETISGSFALHAKKQIQGNKLIVTLIGHEVTEHHEDGKTKTRTREIYRDEVLIEDAKIYPAGHTGVYNFEIATPNMGNPEFMNSTLGKTLAGALNMLSDRRSRMKWKVEARLDAKGVDLATSKSVSISGC